MFQTYKDIIRIGYTVSTTLIILSALANTISFIFYEVKIHVSLKHPVVKKFIPIFRFILLAILWIIWVFIILKELQVNISGILAGAWLWWAIFALASKDIVANLLWSLSLVFSKVFAIWDSISVQWMEWVVEEVTLNYTKITSLNGKVVFIPNRTLLSEKIENLTRRKYTQYQWKIPFTRTSTSTLIEKKLGIIRDELKKNEWIHDITTTVSDITMNDIIYTISGNIETDNQEYYEMFHNFILHNIPRKWE